VLVKEDVEVHLHALQTMTEQFQVCELGHCRLGDLQRCSEITPGPWVHLITQTFHIFPYSNNGTNRILYHDIAAQTIREPSACFTAGTRHSGL
jgi:hypothetical protein